MPKLGTIVCNRCRVRQIMDEAEKKKMIVTMRKSLYGASPSRPGVDIYVHPRTIEIPSHFKYDHKGNLGSIEFMKEIFTDEDPEKWFEAWFSAIPQKCECREATTFGVIKK